MSLAGGNDGWTNPAADRLVHSQSIFRHAVPAHREPLLCESIRRDVWTQSLLQQQHSPLSSLLPTATCRWRGSALHVFVRITNRLFALTTGDCSISGVAVRQRTQTGGRHASNTLQRAISVWSLRLPGLSDRFVRRFAASRLYKQWLCHFLRRPVRGRIDRGGAAMLVDLVQAGSLMWSFSSIWPCGARSGAISSAAGRN